MDQIVCIVSLLLLVIALSIRSSHGQRQSIKSVYGDSIAISGDTDNMYKPQNTTSGDWGNIFASRRKGESGKGQGEGGGDGTGESGESGRGKGFNQKSDKGKSGKTSSSSNKGKGSGSQQSTNLSNGKGKNSKRRPMPPSVRPSTIRPSIEGAFEPSRPPSVKPSTVQPSTAAFEPSRLPKQFDGDAPSESPNDTECDLELLDDFGIRNADCVETIYDRIRAIPDLSITVALIELLDMTSLIECAVGLTVLLPTNSAWEQIDNDIIGELLSSRGILRELFLYHLLPEIALSTNLLDGFRLTLLEDSQVLVGINPLSFDDSSVVVADQLACERRQVYHIVDQVLLPLLRRTYYVINNRSTTHIFVFQEPQILPTKIPEQSPTVSPSSLNIATEIPTASPTNDCSDYDFGGSSGSCKPNLLDAMKQDPTLSLVVSLFELSGLEHIFDCPGPISAALPTNGMILVNLMRFSHYFLEAFISLGQGKLENLTSSDPAALRDLLLYHLFPGIVSSAGLPPGFVTTLSGTQTVVVGIEPLSFGGVKAESTDNVYCNGGVYHTIGSVLNSDYIGEEGFLAYSRRVLTFVIA